MREFLRKNFIYVLFSIVLALIFISFLFLNTTHKISGPIFKPEPTTKPNLPQAGRSYTYVSPSDQQMLDQSRKVAQLIRVLPYKGQNFILRYYYSTNQFALTLYKVNQSEGIVEFKQFLKDNGIDDWHLLKNLIVNVY